MIHKVYGSENYAKNLIKQSIKDMKYENNRSRYKFIDKLLDYYQGDDTGKYIQNYCKPKQNQHFCARGRLRFLGRGLGTPPGKV